MTPAHRILVSDFDGTMTRFDFFDLAGMRLPNIATRDFWQDYVDGRLSHFEALASIFASIRADRKAVEDVLEAMELDPTLPQAVRALETAGWKIIVASAGCSWYIERLLGKAGLSLEIHANPGTFAPESGLLLSRSVSSPWYDPQIGISKTAIMRHAQQTDPQAVFAGDGRPDVEPARLTLSCFARGWLAEHLESAKLPYEPLTTWADLADRLLQR